MATRGGARTASLFTWDQHVIERLLSYSLSSRDSSHPKTARQVGIAVNYAGELYLDRLPSSLADVRNRDRGREADDVAVPLDSGIAAWVAQQVELAAPNSRSPTS